MVSRDMKAHPALCSCFPKLGIPFWGSLHSKDYRIWGSILGTHPCFGKLPQVTDLEISSMRCVSLNSALSPAAVVPKAENSPTFSLFLPVQPMVVITKLAKHAPTASFAVGVDHGVS